MKIIKPSFELEDVNGTEMLKRIEKTGRVCYKSEDKITEDSCFNFVKGIIKKKHESVVEHEKVSVKIICDRGVSHEIVRHRIGSYSQESTRYCNYGNEEICTFIFPFFFSYGTQKYSEWEIACRQAEESYLKLLGMGASPQEARSVLPNSLKTEIVVTFNLREWRHFFKLRTHKTAHPQMREITIPMLEEFKKKIPVVFDDIEVEE